MDGTMFKSEFYPGEVVQLDYSPKMVLGTGSLVQILEVHSQDFVTVTTGCGQWMEFTKYLRKLEN